MIPDTTILIPHFRTGAITAYCIHQILKHKGNNNIDIIVVDNSNGEGLEYLTPFIDYVKLVSYPGNKMQSHGLAFDYAINNNWVQTPWFITLESDSFPTRDGFIDDYADLYEKGYDMAGSLLQLSGGTFVHPTGAMYTTQLWRDAKEFVNTIPYLFFPGLALKEGFPCHLMVQKSIFNDFMQRPRQYIVPDKAYTMVGHSLFAELILQEHRYRPIAQSVFHQGMGFYQESYNTYGQRDPTTAGDALMPDEPDKLIWRLGMEPGQFLFNFAIANKYRVGNIPTEVKWLPNREGQQQEYTMSDTGIKHLWGVSAYDKCEAPEVQDIVQHKAKEVEELYNSMEAKWKI